MITSECNISHRDLPEAEVRESLIVINMTRMSSSVRKDLTLIITSKMKDLNYQEEAEVEVNNASSREQQLTTTIAGRMINLSRDKISGLDAEVGVPNPPDASLMSDKETRLYSSLSAVKIST